MTEKVIQGTTVRVDVAPGELMDKITILQIKQERISDPAKRLNVGNELTLLCDAKARHVESSHRRRASGSWWLTASRCRGAARW